MISNLKIRIKELEEQLQEREVKYQLTHLGFCTMFLDLFVFSPFFLLQCGWDFFKLCKELTLSRFFSNFWHGPVRENPGKGVLILVNLPSLKVIGLKRATTICIAPQSCNNLQTIVLGGGQVCNPRPYKCL